MTDNGLSTRMERLQRVALLVGLVGMATAVLLAVFVAPSESFTLAPFFRAYLIAYLIVLAPCLGSMALLMIHHLTGGDWGTVIRPVLRGASRTIPILALLFVPILFGLPDIYPWARWTQEEIAHSSSLEQKSMYLNIPAFCIRAAIYFVVWLGLSYLLTRDNGDEASERRKERLSGPGLVLFALAVTFAAIDWLMSIEPFWFSTIYGLLFASGQVLAALAFGILCLALASRASEVTLPRGPMNDLGSLLLTLVMIWAYMAFSQFLLIWSSNLPEEIPWYMKRLQGGWQILALALVLAQFVLPFLLLLSRDLKRNARSLAMVAGLVLVMRAVDLYWMVAPAYFPYQGIRMHLIDLAAIVGLSGLWLAAFLFVTRGRPLVGFVPAEAEHERHHV